MANNIQNKLKVIGTDKEINDFFDSIKSIGDTVEDARTIDFNKIIKQPILKNTEDEIHWCYKNWNTKWNSYNNYDDRDTYDTIYFQTAWNNVLGLIKTLSVRFPNLDFEYSYFDEDLGVNVGFHKIKKGNSIFQDCPENFSKEAYELAFNIAKAKPSDFGLKFDCTINNYVDIYESKWI